MEAKALTTLIFGFLLGTIHALDADHIVAVSAIVSRSKSLIKACMIGFMWAIGHTLTLLLAGILVLGFKLNISEKFALSMEFFAGVVLVILGVPLVKSYLQNNVHIHSHIHGNKAHLHIHSHRYGKGHLHAHDYKSLLVGMVHGLAGSAALMLIAISTVDTFLGGFMYVFVFGLGSILGMLIVGGILGLPFILTSHLPRANEGIRLAAGLISIGLGSIIIWKIGFSQNLFFGS